MEEEEEEQQQQQDVEEEEEEEEEEQQQQQDVEEEFRRSSPRRYVPTTALRARSTLFLQLGRKLLTWNSAKSLGDRGRCLLCPISCICNAPFLTQYCNAIVESSTSRYPDPPTRSRSTNPEMTPRLSRFRRSTLGQDVAV